MKNFKTLLYFKSLSLSVFLIIILTLASPSYAQKILRDLTTGSGWGLPEYADMTEYNGAIYFSGSTAGTNYELWKTSYKSTLFSKKEPWITDGTVEGTLLLREYLKNIVSFEQIQSAGSAGDYLFLEGKLAGKNSIESHVTDGASLKTFDFFDGGPSGKYLFGATLGNGVVVSTYGGTYFYNPAKQKSTFLSSNNPFGSYAVGKQKYYFHADNAKRDSLLLIESDGTLEGTHAISQGIEDNYYDPAILIWRDQVFYTTRVIGNSQFS